MTRKSLIIYIIQHNLRCVTRCDSSEEVDCPSSNDHNFRSFASIELIFFCLNRSRNRHTDFPKKTKPQRAFYASAGAVLCRLPPVSCLFLLVSKRRKESMPRLARLQCCTSRHENRDIFLQDTGTSQHRMARHDQSRLACVGWRLCVQPTVIDSCHPIRVARLDSWLKARAKSSVRVLKVARRR